MVYTHSACGNFEQLRRIYACWRIAIAKTTIYVVAYALYTRALSVAQQIHTPGNDGNVLVARVRTGQQAAFDLLRIGESELEKSSLPLA